MKGLTIKNRRKRIVSFKEFKERNRRLFLKDKILKKDALAQMSLIKKSQLEEAIKSGLLREITFRNRKYFVKEELMQYARQLLQPIIKNLERITNL